MPLQENAMPQMKEERQEPPPAARGNTETAQGETRSPIPRPREPHERDESADSQGADASEIRRMGEIAHGSAERGEQDTTRGAELDDTYHRMREGADPAPIDKRNQNQKPG
jgi:hypothetical protein